MPARPDPAKKETIYSDIIKLFFLFYAVFSLAFSMNMPPAFALLFCFFFCYI